MTQYDLDELEDSVCKIQIPMDLRIAQTSGDPANMGAGIIGIGFFGGYTIL